MWLTLLRHVLDIFGTRYRHCLDMFQTSFAHVAQMLDMCWTCVVHVLEMSGHVCGTRFELCLEMFLTSSEHVLDMIETWLTYAWNTGRSCFKNVSAMFWQSFDTFGICFRHVCIMLHTCFRPTLEHIPKGRRHRPSGPFNYPKRILWSSRKLDTPV